jgi:uncharacterized protein DUF1566
METRRTLTLGCLVATMMALGAGPAQAVTSAGPYYAEPSWDQKLDCTATTNCPRFIVLSNWNSEAVLDRETGLVWEKLPGDTSGNGIVDNNDDKIWSEARHHCANKAVGGRQGWRLPSVPELASLLDPNIPSGNRLPPGHPFTKDDIQSAGYWSATASAGGTTNVWFVDFDGHETDKGVIVFVDTDSNSSITMHYVWCVRGGMNADAY